VFEHHARGGRRIGIDDVIGPLAGVAEGLGNVVIEGEIDTWNIGQVGGDVARRDGNLAILHVLGVDERDLVNQVQFIEQNGYRNISERNLVYPRELQNIKMLLEKKIAMTLVDTFDYGFVKDILDNINELQKYFNKKRLCESIKEAQQKNNEPTAPKRYH
jgi:hypothetical protein